MHHVVPRTIMFPYPPQAEIVTIELKGEYPFLPQSDKLQGQLCRNTDAPYR